jgi:pyrroloquinoline quinone biosynthesis protein D
MQTRAGPGEDARPRLPKGVRLRHDEARGEWLLLAPERVVKADAIAVEILKRCTGERTIRDIVDDLAVVYAADRARIAADVRALLAELAAKRMLDL